MVFFMHGHLYSKNGLQTRLTANVCRPFFCFICGYETLSGSQYVITGGSSFACAIIFSTSLNEGTRLQRFFSSFTAASFG